MAGHRGDNCLREVDGNVPQGHKPTVVKRKKCDDLQNTDSDSSPDTKKRIRHTPCRTRSSSTPCRAPTERAYKKYAIGRIILREDEQARGELRPERLRTEEKNNQVDPKYLNQTEITRHHRLNALNQIALIHVVEKTSSKTVFLATSIFDRFLSRSLGFPRSELLTLALASFFVACKHEQFHFPLNYHLNVLSMTLTQLLDMEKRILKLLGSELRVPTALGFLRLFSQAQNTSDEHHYILSKYFLELSHREYNMLAHYPSKVAAAAMMISNKMLGRPWSPDFILSTGYEEAELLEPANTLISTLRKEAKNFATNGLPCSPTTLKYDVADYGHLVPFALSPKIQEDRLTWSSSSFPSSSSS